MTNLAELTRMIYSGRGVHVGMTPKGEPFLAYHLTGRSPPSQKREFQQGEKTGVIRTAITDREQLERGSSALLVYPAIIPVQSVASDGVQKKLIGFVASNGVQTELIYSRLMRNSSLGNVSRADDVIAHSVLQGIFTEAFHDPDFRYDPEHDRLIDITDYEPDENSTSRVNAILLGSSAYMHSVHKEEGSMRRVINHFPICLRSGVIRSLSTYAGGNEKPLKPFTSNPLEGEIKITSLTPKDIAEELYAAIGPKGDDNYRVGVVVVMKDVQPAIINRSQRGA